MSILNLFFNTATAAQIIFHQPAKIAHNFFHLSDYIALSAVASNIQTYTTVDAYNSKQMNRLPAALVLSFLLHLAVLFGVTFEFPSPDFDRIATSLEVVLVNSKTEIKPADTELLAQSNLDGGGNVDENRRAKTPFPVIPRSKPTADHLIADEKVKKLEQKSSN